MTLVQIMNSANMNSKNIVNKVSIFNDSDAMNIILGNKTRMNNISFEYYCDEH